MRRALLAGTFGFPNLFGFWLPLYQFGGPLVSTFGGTPFYVSKLVSAVTGTGGCLLVYAISHELTADRRAGLLSFALLASNPQHIQYSASAMTDVPHAFLILLCAYCCIRSRWLGASIFAFLAGLMRIESWGLIVVIRL